MLITVKDLEMDNRFDMKVRLLMFYLTFAMFAALVCRFWCVRAPESARCRMAECHDFKINTGIFVMSLSFSCQKCFCCVIVASSQNVFYLSKATRSRDSVT